MGIISKKKSTDKIEIRPTGSYHCEYNTKQYS